MRCLLPAISSAFSLAAISLDQQFVNRTASCAHNMVNELIKTSIFSFCLFLKFSSFHLHIFLVYTLSMPTPLASLFCSFSSFPFLHLYLSIMLMPMSEDTRRVLLLKGQGARSQEGDLAGQDLSMAAPTCICKPHKIIDLPLCTAANSCLFSGLHFLSIPSDAAFRRGGL